MKMKLFLIFMAGAAITASVLTYVEARKIRAEGYELFYDTRKVSVLVALEDLPSQTMLTSNTVAIKRVFKSNLGSYILTPSDYEKIKNKQLKYPVRKHEPILSLYVESVTNIMDGIIF